MRCEGASARRASATASCGSSRPTSHRQGLWGARSMIVAAVAMISSPGINAAQPRQQVAEAELIHALAAYHQATVNNDIKALSALVTDDYLLVNSDGSVQDKTSYLADFRVPGFRIDPYEVQQAFIRRRAGAALTGGRFRLQWTQEGRRQVRGLLFAHFWVQQAGQWRIAYTQLTQAPE